MVLGNAPDQLILGYLNMPMTAPTMNAIVFPLKQLAVNAERRAAR